MPRSKKRWSNTFADSQSTLRVEILARVPRFSKSPKITCDDAYV